MTIKDLCRFKNELRALEQQFGPLQYAYVGDEDYWIECCDWQGREIRIRDGAVDAQPAMRLLEANSTEYVVKFRYYYPSDLFATLFATSDCDRALHYLRNDYLNTIKNTRH